MTGDEPPPSRVEPLAVPATPEQTIRLATEIAEVLRSRLLDVARAVAGPSFRPSRLVDALGIDRNLAARLSRGLRADSSHEMLHLMPSPAALAFFLDAAERAGCAAATLRAGRVAVAGLEDLLDRMPGGRAELDAVMAENAVEVRERAERTASLSVYRGMSYLLGFRCETITSALILHPSADGRTADGLEVGRREGIRRLRPSAPVAIFSLNLTTADPSGTASMEMLRADADPEDPRSVLLPDFCDPREPALQLHRTGPHAVFALPDDEDAPPGGVTISTAFHVRRGYLRWREGTCREEFRLYLMHYPCKLLVRDLYIHEDLYVGSEPRLWHEFPVPAGAPRPESTDPAMRLNQLDLSTPIVSLGRGLQRAPVAGVSQHAKLLEHVFERAGLEAERFRGYRATIHYPVPMITTGWSLPLPETRVVLGGLVKERSMQG